MRFAIMAFLLSMTYLSAKADITVPVYMDLCICSYRRKCSCTFVVWYSLL